MLPLKLMSSLVSGDNKITNSSLLCSQNHHFPHHDRLDDNRRRTDRVSTTQSSDKIPLMLFVPTQELVTDTYRLSKIARAIGMDLRPNPSLSHIVFSWSSPPCSSASSLSPSPPSSYAWSLPNGAVPLPFPSFKTATLTHLRLFANLSKGYFKLAFLNSDSDPIGRIKSLSNNNWHCSSLALCFAQTGEKIDSMDGFSKALLGTGWTLFKTSCGDVESRKSRITVVYLYRKLDVYKICNKRRLPGKEDSGQCSNRVRELRLPKLDFGNVPLRILQYILLMTDDTFYLA